MRQLDWEELDEWQTPTGAFFAIKHFNHPEIDAADWRLEIGDLVS